MQTARIWVRIDAWRCGRSLVPQPLSSARHSRRGDGFGRSDDQRQLPAEPDHAHLHQSSEWCVVANCDRLHSSHRRFLSGHDYTGGDFLVRFEGRRPLQARPQVRPAFGKCSVKHRRLRATCSLRSRHGAVMPSHGSEIALASASCCDFGGRKRTFTERDGDG